MKANKKRKKNYKKNVFQTETDNRESEKKNPNMSVEKETNEEKQIQTT